MDKEDVIYTQYGILLSHNSVTKGERGRRGELGVWNKNTYTTIYKIHNNKDLLYI